MGMLCGWGLEFSQALILNRGLGRASLIWHVPSLQDWKVRTLLLPPLGAGFGW